MTVAVLRVLFAAHDDYASIVYNTTQCYCYILCQVATDTVGSCALLELAKNESVLV